MAWHGRTSLTDHVVGNVDLDLSLILEGHLALDTLVRLFLFGNKRRNQVSRVRKVPTTYLKVSQRGLASPRCPSTLSSPLPLTQASPGHRPPPSKGLFSCWSWDNFAVCQGQLPQKPGVWGFPCLQRQIHVSTHPSASTPPFQLGHHVPVGISCMRGVVCQLTRFGEYLDPELLACLMK